MSKILILLLLFIVVSNKESKDLILIGDCRIEEMSLEVIGAQKASFKYNGHYFSAIMTYKPISFKDYNIEITAVKIVSNFYEMSDATLHAYSQLKNAKEGTNVLLNLGIDNLNDFIPIASFIEKLADKYKHLNFYVVSIVGVDEKLCDIFNSDIKEFNRRMENRIELLALSNLKYKSILNEENPTKIKYNDKVVDILDYVTEETGFSKEGYEIIFNAMVEGL